MYVVCIDSEKLMLLGFFLMQICSSWKKTVPLIEVCIPCTDVKFSTWLGMHKGSIILKKWQTPKHPLNFLMPNSLLLVGIRTMQTAAGVFGCHNLTDGMDVTPRMVADVNSGQEAISSLNCPPFIAVELCRERLIESDDDNLWMPDVRESDEDLAARGMKFMSWLWTRKEKEIAVVTHSAFLFHTLREFENRCHPSMKTEICK
ncbi:hypothetical protein Ancab_016691, partial [Ancistrocladus abbreviatus]